MHRNPWVLVRAGAVALFGAGLLVLANCGSSSSNSSGSAPNAGNGAGGGFAADAGMGASAGAGGTSVPPEKELESAYRTPVATGKYVWAANPDSGRVALINAATLDVQTVQAGDAPTYIAAVSDPNDPTENAAIVLNVLSQDATLFNVAPDGSIAEKTLPTHEGANAWAISPSGHWAIAWSDARKVKNPDPTDSFQDVTVIDLAPGKETATRLTVGYRPVSISFNSAETRAYAVTDPGISVIALDGSTPHSDPLVPLDVGTDGGPDQSQSRDVSITPDGSLALVRHAGSPNIGVVSLTTGNSSVITLSGPVTDLDLSADGKRAVAVVRSQSDVSILPIPDVATDPSSVVTEHIDGETFGSVSLSPDASVALLYTNATPNDHVTILNSGASGTTHRTVSLMAPVEAVLATPDGQNAIALQTPAAGSSRAGAFSVIPTAVLQAPRIVGTDAPATAVAIAPAPNSDRALVTVRDDQQNIFGVYLIRMPSLQVDETELASAPIATGIVPAVHKGYVAQLYPDGRITFIDLIDGSVRTLTGFELGAKVVE